MRNAQQYSHRAFLLRNDLSCVEWHGKLYFLINSLFCAYRRLTRHLWLLQDLTICICLSPSSVSQHFSSSSSVVMRLSVLVLCNERWVSHVRWDTSTCLRVWWVTDSTRRRRRPSILYLKRRKKRRIVRSCMGVSDAILKRQCYLYSSNSNETKLL